MAARDSGSPSAEDRLIARHFKPLAKHPGAPHTIYEEVWHLAFWQQISLKWARGIETPVPEPVRDFAPAPPTTRVSEIPAAKPVPPVAPARTVVRLSDYLRYPELTHEARLMMACLEARERADAWARSPQGTHYGDLEPTVEVPSESPARKVLEDL